MSISFEIRVCQSCDLRYPIATGHPFGVRCPHCLGETTVVISREITEEFSAEDIKKGNGMSVLVDNVRSAWNVGSIMRSADGFGFGHIYLCGITPTPDQDAVRKTALGAEEFVTWSYHKDAVKLVQGLKKEGWKIWALEDDQRAVDIQKAGVKKRKQKPEEQTANTVLIVGSEVTGVDPDLLNLCDEILFIPMHGQKRSFNVSVAFGVAAFALRA